MPCLIEFATETLAGIPSIIFGLFGKLFFGETLGFSFSILTGAFTMALMVLPLVTRNTQEALKTVPDSYRTGAIGLGAGGAVYWFKFRKQKPDTKGPDDLDDYDFGDDDEDDEEEYVIEDDQPEETDEV